MSARSTPAFDRDLTLLETIAAKGQRPKAEVEALRLFGEVSTAHGVLRRAIDSGMVREVQIAAVELTDEGIAALAALTAARARSTRNKAAPASK